MKTKKVYLLDGKEVKLGGKFNYTLRCNDSVYKYYGTCLTEDIADELVELGFFEIKEESVKLPNIKDVLNANSENCGKVREVINELANIDKFAAFNTLLRWFSIELDKIDLLEIYGPTSVYTIHASTGKVNPITVYHKDNLNNVAWFKSTEYLNYAVSQIREYYDAVYKK